MTAAAIVVSPLLFPSKALFVMLQATQAYVRVLTGTLLRPDLPHSTVYLPLVLRAGWLVRAHAAARLYATRAAHLALTAMMQGSLSQSALGGGGGGGGGGSSMGSSGGSGGSSLLEDCPAPSGSGGGGMLHSVCLAAAGVDAGTDSRELATMWAESVPFLPHVAMPDGVSSDAMHYCFQLGLTYATFAALMPLAFAWRAERRNKVTWLQGQLGVRVVGGMPTAEKGGKLWLLLAVVLFSYVSSFIFLLPWWPMVAHQLHSMAFA